MASKKSEISKYVSRYDGGFITSAQFVAEKVCENIARVEKEKLPPHFWSLPKWKKVFAFQVVLANRLLSGKNKLGRAFSPHAVVAALDHSRAYYVKSLGALFILGSLMNTEQDKLDQKEKLLGETESVDYEAVKIEPPRPSISAPKNNLFNKLKDLD